MLQKNSFFRSPEPAPARGLMPPATAPAAHEPAKPADKEKEKGESRKEAKLVVGPDIKMKGVEVNDCDTLQVEGRIEATLDARVLEITEKGVFSGTVAVGFAMFWSQSPAFDPADLARPASPRTLSEKSDEWLRSVSNGMAAAQCVSLKRIEVEMECRRLYQVGGIGIQQLQLDRFAIALLLGRYCEEVRGAACSR